MYAGFWQLKSAVKNSPQKSLKINTLTLGMHNVKEDCTPELGVPEMQQQLVSRCSGMR